MFVVVRCRKAFVVDDVYLLSSPRLHLYSTAKAEFPGRPSLFIPGYLPTAHSKVEQEHLQNLPWCFNTVNKLLENMWCGKNTRNSGICWLWWPRFYKKVYSFAGTSLLSKVSDTASTLVYCNQEHFLGNAAQKKKQLIIMLSNLLQNYQVAAGQSFVDACVWLFIQL